MKEKRAVISLAVACWLGFWLYFTRYAMLDDALIHLRYAVNLHTLRYFTYNGGAPSYGASSILYVWIISLFAGVPGVVFLPKIFSAVCYVGLILVLVCLAFRSNLSRRQFFLWMLLLACNLSPMAVRWMPNGMETSMVSLMAATFAVIVVRFTSRPSSGPFTFAVLTVFGFFLTMLRIELASLSVVAGIIILLGQINHARGGSLRFLPFMISFAPVLGALSALGLTHHIFGSLLPDTAIAKSAQASLGPFFASAKVIASSFVFGIGLLGIAVLSAAFLLRQYFVRNRINWTILTQWAAANSPFPMLVSLACLRGQSVQGIRYLVWPLLFSSVWNLLQLDNLDCEAEGRHLASEPRILLYSVQAYAILLIICLPMDWIYAVHSMKGRSETFLQMKGAGLERFQNSTIIAGDVGFIGYFTGGTICDIDGLINGRAAARKKSAERITACVSQNPRAIFVTAGQAHSVAEAIDLDNWVICRIVDFPNVRSSDRHYLLVRAPERNEACSTRSIIPLKDALNN